MNLSHVRSGHRYAFTFANGQTMSGVVTDVRHDCSCRSGKCLTIKVGSDLRAVPFDYITQVSKTSKLAGPPSTVEGPPALATGVNGEPTTPEGGPLARSLSSGAA